ncbi:MAG: hypothetical protein ACOH5I_02185 [Oligoflexus sp.]
MKRSQFSSLATSSLILVLSLSCGKDGDNKGHFLHHNQGAPPSITADFSGAMGVLVIDPSSGNNLWLNGIHNLSLSLTEEENGDGSLVKVGADGEISPALTSSNEENPGFMQDLPRVATIALSPAGDIYLHFEHPFVYRAPENPEDWSKVWDHANGYQCQIFKVLGGTIDDLRVNPPEAGSDNLECIDNMRFVDSWQAQRNSVFQFDADSNVYYPGSIPNGHGKMVVYRRSRDGADTSEVINANICVQDFLVTPNGGVFYTGTSQCDGGGGDGGFFRYVSPESEVREIARDWWNFVFEPVADTEGDQAVFFGPDPRNATTASWDSACLFRFDPSAGSTAADSISESITCGNDIWSWISMTRTVDVEEFNGYNPHSGNQEIPEGWVEEFTSRCTSEGDVFAGGGSQINAIKQDSNGEVYVIGRVRMKKEGEVTCSVNVKGPHCALRGAPYLAGHDDYGTEEKCQSSGGSWVINQGWCNGGGGSTLTTCHDADGGAGDWHYHDVHYGNVASPLCSVSSDHPQIVGNGVIWNTDVIFENAEPAPAPIFSRGWLGCQIKNADSGNNWDWTNEYRGLAKVDQESKSLVLLSGKDEQAINIWLVNDVPYYSTYNTDLGQYLLKRYNSEDSESIVVAEKFEAYNIERSNESGKVFYDGLDFETNSYSFGTMSQTAPYERTIKTGLTGTVKTIVILPE